MIEQKKKKLVTTNYSGIFLLNAFFLKLTGEIWVITVDALNYWINLLVKSNGFIYSL